MMTKLYAALAAAAVMCFLAGTAGYIYLRQSQDAFAQCRDGQPVGGDIGGPFTLVDETGKTVTQDDVLSGPTLLYFGYTYCPDVCPIDAARNAEAVDILEEQGFDVTPVFVSVDPARDTPEVLAAYTEQFHPRMIGLTGTEAEVKRAADAYKTVYQKRIQDDPEFYLMDHMTLTYLMLPQRGFIDVFRRDETADAVAQKVACFAMVNESQQKN